MPRKKRKISPKKFAIVISEFNIDVTHLLLEGAYKRLLEKKIKAKDILIARVPGAVEIPLAAQWLAQSKQYQAIICLGAVIRGETGHYEYVCQQASTGCQTVMLQYNIPIIFGVLTTENTQQAFDRAGGSVGHKGVEAADAAIMMTALRDSL